MRRTSILALLVLLHGSAAATTTVVASLDDLVARTDEVHIGRVTAIESRWQRGVIVSRIRVAVDETVKGARAAVLDVEVDGGLVDGVRMEVIGAPRWRIGDRSLLFLRRHGAVLRPVAIAQAKVDLRAGDPAGAELVARVRTLARGSRP